MSKKVKVDDFKQLMRDMFGDRYIDAGGINDPIMHNNKKILTESLNKNLRMTDKKSLSIGGTTTRQYELDCSTPFALMHSF